MTKVQMNQLAIYDKNSIWQVSQGASSSALGGDYRKNPVIKPRNRAMAVSADEFATELQKALTLASGGDIPQDQNKGSN